MDTFSGSLAQIQGLSAFIPTDLSQSQDFPGGHPHMNWQRAAPRKQPDLPLGSSAALWWHCTLGDTPAECHAFHLAPAVTKLSQPVGICRMVAVQGSGWSVPVTFEPWLRESSHCLCLLTTCFAAGHEPMESFPGKKTACSFFPVNAFIHSGAEGAKFCSTLGSVGTLTKKLPFFLKVWLISL